MTDKDILISDLNDISEILNNNGYGCWSKVVLKAVAMLKEQEPDASKYQYKYDHTDCIWYRDSRSKCPVTCSQYRDGWNDAMNFVFKNGAGYSPYKRR